MAVRRLANSLAQTARRGWSTGVVVALASMAACAARSQTADVSFLASPQAFAALARESSPFAVERVGAAMPDGSSLDSVSAVGSSSAVGLPEPAPPEPVASLYTKYIPAGVGGHPLTARAKFIVGVQDMYSPFSLLASLVDAGYAQTLNTEPNYGTDSGAFGQRLGAITLRDATQGFFCDSLLAPLLHEDPRYFVEGRQYSFLHRIGYAASRPLITRSDRGKSTVNGALLLGYAGASALSYTYYPQINKNVHDTVSTFGGSLEGAAIGFLVSEFSAQVFEALHLQRRP